jgi:polyisoprenoid-binding protein YceI
MRAVLLALVIGSVAAPAAGAVSGPAGHDAAPGKYELDKGRARLVARVHVGFWRYSLRFNSLSGSFSYDPGNWRATRVVITVDPKSIESGQRGFSRAAAGFFEPEKYPVIRFVSSRITPTGGGRGLLAGDLTMHGVTRPVTLDLVFHSPDGGEPGAAGRMGFSGTGRVRRSDFKLTGGWPFAGDQVDLLFDVEFVKFPRAADTQVANRLRGAVAPEGDGEDLNPLGRPPQVAPSAPP